MSKFELGLSLQGSNKSNNILKVATGGDTVNITNAYEDNRLIIISFLFILMIRSDGETKLYV